MNSKRLTCFLWFICLFVFSGCSSGTSVSSPGNTTRLELHLRDDGSLSYTLFNRGRTVVENGRLGVETAQAGAFFENLRLKSSGQILIDETYSLPTGKTSLYQNRCNQTTYIVENQEGFRMELLVRAYDDGAAFRYVIDRPGEITVLREHTSFPVDPSAKTWIMDWIHHNENFFPERDMGGIEDTHLLYPALIRTGEDWLLLTEASVYDQPATHLMKHSAAACFTVAFPEENPSFTVKDRYESPWRTFILSDDLAGIVESTLVENLNPAPVLEDTSWIEPGVAVFPWWGDNLANSHIDTLKKYVDLAAEMGWGWIEFDVALVGSPLRTSKLWETTGWLPDFTAYARSRNVHVYGWDEISVLDHPAGRDHVFGKYRDLGIRGIKIDYINSDSQYAMKFRDTVSRAAADYGLMVSFHGETIPRGQRRKYPNILTLEGVRGAEWYQFAGHSAPTPRHNCTLPFTRNVIGPMDYTPVTFTIREENPRTTTYAHELALPFIFESGWTCMADRPEMYLRSPAKPMLKRIEAAWDETRFLDGYPGEYVCLARRKGNSWYIAAINSDTPRQVPVKLDFLPEGAYAFDVYEDKPGGDLTDLQVRRESKQQGDILNINLPANGGFCTVIDF